MRYSIASIHVLLIITLFACGESDNVSSSEAKVATSEASVETASKNMKVDINPILDCIAKTDGENPVTICFEMYKGHELLPEQADSLAYFTNLKLQEIANDVDIESDNMVDSETGELNYELLNPFLNNGFWADQEEGYYFLAVDYSKLHTWFATQCGPEMKAYLDFRKNNKEKISYDAALILEPMEMAKRLCEMENLLKTGNLFSRQLLMESFIYELSWAYTGMDNTWGFDYENNEYLPEYREALNYYIKNGGTVIKHFTKTMEMEMENSKWKYTENIRKWINSETIERKTLATYPLK